MQRVVDGEGRGRAQIQFSVFHNIFSSFVISLTVVVGNVILLCGGDNASLAIDIDVFEEQVTHGSDFRG